MNDRPARPTHPPLHACFYASRVADGISRHQVDLIVWKSNRSNWREGITGSMAYTGEHFAQWLEGPEPAVRQVVARIERDPRHTGMQMILDQSIERRLFGLWNMRLDADPALNALLADLSAPLGPERREAILNAFLTAGPCDLNPAGGEVGRALGGSQGPPGLRVGGWAAGDPSGAAAPP